MSRWPGRGRSGAFAVLAFAAIGLGSPAWAADRTVAEAPPALAVGVIDMQRILRDSVPGKSVVKQREQMLNAYQAEAVKQEKELREADQELARQRSILSADAFAEKQNAFRKRFSEFQRSVEARRRGVEKVTAEALAEIDGKVIEVTQALAKERALNVILHQSQLFMFDSKFDITDAAMDRLNKALPKVALKDPTKAPAPVAAPAPATAGN